tara:strand:- start:1107 stop:2780 length:1674 start_codon:yes stop_codon:yes gene_type:complete
MLILDTFYLIISSLLLYPLGKLFFKNLDFIFQLFFSLLIAGLILSFTARFVPAYSREILGIISFISLIVFYASYRNDPNFLTINNKVDNHSKLRMFLIFLSIFGLFLFLLREFSPFLYSFESHDVHVFGPTIELFNSQYIGNLKNPIIFPLELSAYHILPGTFLGAANFLNPTIDLIALINAKYFLAALFLSYCFFKIFIFSNFSISSFAAGIILLFFFKETFGYNLSISSYLYQFILIFLTITFFEIERQPNDVSLKEAFIGLMMILACVKIPIFYVVIPPLIYLLYDDYKIFFKPRILSIAILSFFSLVAIVAIPQSKEIAEITRYSLMNVFDFDSARSLAGLWFVENRFLDILNFSSSIVSDVTINKYINLIVKMLYILIFYFGLSFFALSTYKKSKVRKALKIYLLTGILGWLFVRNNGNLDQQNHLFFNISLMSVILFTGAFSNFRKYQWQNTAKIISLIILMFVFSDLNNFKNPKLSGDSLNYRNNKSITLPQFLSRNLNLKTDRLKINKDMPYWEQALLSQMSGTRIYYQDLKDNEIEFSKYHLSQYALK